MAAIETFLNDIWPFHMFFAVQIVLAEMLFVCGQPKRSRFALRLVFGLLFYLLLAWFHPYYWNTLVRVLFIFGWSMLLVWFLLDVPFKRVLFIGLVSYALQNLSFNLGDFVTSVIGIDRGPLSFYLIAGSLFTLVYALAYFLIVQRFNKNSDLYINNVSMLLLAAVTILTVFSKNLVYGLHVLTDYELLVFFNMLSVVLVLFIQFSTLRQGRISEEKHIIEQLLQAEEKSRAMRQENIDIINMKCHDLRYHLDEYRKSVADDKHNQFFAEVAKSIGIYDNTPDTGNGALNALFAEKLLYCEANGITVSYIIDAAAIEQMSTSDIYSLFGNAFDNAIESAEKAEREKRIISISAQKKGGFGQIVFSNYCAEKPLMRDGLPVSSKDSALHGFGVRSIRYIVEKYRGNLVIDWKESMFTLSILLPLPEEKAQKKELSAPLPLSKQ